MLAWILIPVGILMVVYANKIYFFIGEIEFAERWMPTGGTPAFIKIMGLLLTFGAFSWIIGGGDGIRSILAKFF